MIDWTKPIETVPCDRNPVPVPCVAVADEYDDEFYTVKFCGPWLDFDGQEIVSAYPEYLCWGVEDNGIFLTLDGAVRNVAESN